MKLRINKICFGFNLTDVAIYSISTLMAGGIKKCDYYDKKVKHPNTDVHYIKPLNNLKNIECAIYAELNEINYVLDECPYYKEGIRDDIRDVLNELEMRHPGSLELMTNGFYELAKTNATNINTNICKTCGVNFYSNKPQLLCTACFMLDLIRKN